MEPHPGEKPLNRSFLHTCVLPEPFARSVPTKACPVILNLGTGLKSQRTRKRTLKIQPQKCPLGVEDY